MIDGSGAQLNYSYYPIHFLVLQEFGNLDNPDTHL